MSEFYVDPNIRKARTITSDFYTDRDYFELSKEKIFARSWHIVGAADRKESLTPMLLLPGFLDEPILIVKAGEKNKCVSNVCTHRGKILVEEPCDGDGIRCRYHGRRFSLDGKFLSMPEFEGVSDFPDETDDLRQLPLSEWMGFLFTAIDPISTFEEFIIGATEHLGDVRPSELHLDSSREYKVNAHWALYCENYLEGFHIPYVHHALNKVVDYGTYTTDTFRYASLQTGYGDDGSVAARYLFVFPNMMFNFYPWGISVNIVSPVSPSNTVVQFLTFVSDGSLREQGASADLHGVEMEDEAVVESVQRGIRSRFYSQGRYSPTREQGTHHFHRLIAEFMK